VVSGSGARGLISGFACGAIDPGFAGCKACGRESISLPQAFFYSRFIETRMIFKSKSNLKLIKALNIKTDTVKPAVR
jgi:hypothetical protein